MADATAPADARELLKRLVESKNEVARTGCNVRFAHDDASLGALQVAEFRAIQQEDEVWNAIFDYLAEPPPAEPRSPTIEGAAARLLKAIGATVPVGSEPWRVPLGTALYEGPDAVELHAAARALDALLRGERGVG